VLLSKEVFLQDCCTWRPDLKFRLVFSWFV